MKTNTPMKAIRAKCLDCMCFQIAEARRCPATECPLYPYRMGHRPKIDGLKAATADETEREG